MPKDEIGQARSFAGSGPDRPIPLFQDLGASAPVPLDALDALGPLGPAVETITRATMAPTALAMQAVLSSVSLVVQGHADVALLSGTAPAGLFCLTVAESGERKSGVFRLANQPIRAFEAAYHSVPKSLAAAWPSCPPAFFPGEFSHEQD